MQNITRFKNWCIWNNKIIKILENCFQNMNCYSWTKLIPVLVHLRYWYYSSPYLEFSCLSHHFCQIYPSQLKLLSNTILITFFIGFPILSYPIRLQAPTSIGYITPYANLCQSNVLLSDIDVIISFESNMLPIKELNL